MRASVVLVIATVVIAPVAYMAMFTGFLAYDDEGYFLILLRDYLSGQPLLTPATPIYGPFFFETMGGAFRVFGLAVGNDSGRFVTGVIWLLSSLIAAIAVYRLTRSLLLTVGAELVAFHALVALTFEPMSPQGLIALLLVALALVSTFRATRPRLTGLAIGGIVAALCLIKINIGVFVGAAVAVAWAAGLPDRHRRLVLPVAVIAMVALPVAVTSSLLQDAWVDEFAFAVACSSAAFGAIVLAVRSVANPPGEARWIAGGAVLLSVVCLAIAVAGGTSPGDLWTELIVVALRFPHVFTVPIDLSVGVDVAALLSLVAAIVVARSGGRIRPSAAIRATVGLSVWLAVLLLPTTVFLFTLPAVWLAGIGPGDRDSAPVAGYSRVLLPALAITNTLQAYPVSGTQLYLAALPQIFVGAICLADALQAARLGSRSRRLPSAMVWTAALMAGLAFAVNTTFTANAYRAAVPLGLTGAQQMRMPASKAADVRNIVGALEQQCATFITYPGMNSFYIWTQQNPPTEVRSEIWMVTFDAAQQQSLVDRLARVPGLCVVEDEREIEFWTAGQAVPERPLVEYITGSFGVAAESGDYKLLVRRTTA